MSLLLFLAKCVEFEPSLDPLKMRTPCNGDFFTPNRDLLI